MTVVTNAFRGKIINKITIMLQHCKEQHSPLSFLVILITGCSRSILRHSSSPDNGSMVGVGAITCSIAKRVFQCLTLPHYVSKGFFRRRQYLVRYSNSQSCKKVRSLIKQYLYSKVLSFRALFQCLSAA